ncbi:hypothetical protein [Neolewinella sp.]|uniref:hypothetical protein n=1 Tax=Neolewinella sp. TaxID=2993543 RepID=UPI003B527F3C
MRNTLLSPKAHGVLDYALATSLLVLPSLFGFSRKVRKVYAAEGVVLLTYVGLTEHPAAVRPLIPFWLHGKIDPYNIGQFTLQTFLPPFREDGKVQLFNVLFTVAAGGVVAFTDWSRSPAGSTAG